MDAFEKHIKNILENHEPAVDVEELWGKVQPALDKKRFRLWPFFLLLSLGLVSGLFVFLDSGISRTSQEQTLLNEDTSFFGKPGQLIALTPASLGAVSSPQEEAVTPGKNIQTTHTPSLIQSKNLSKISDFSNSNTVNENDGTAGSAHALAPAGIDQNPGGTIVSTPEVDMSPLIQPVIFLDEKFLLPMLRPDVSFPELKYSIDLFSGIDYTTKFLSAKNLDDTWYKEKREQTEKRLESWHLGALFNAKHTSGWFAGTGLSYYHTTELFESKDRVLIEKLTEDIVEIITYADGVIEERSGSKIILEPKSWEKKKFNTYRFMDIPVYLGYALPLKKVHLEIYAGASMNLLFTRNGEILGADGLPVSLDGPGGSVFRKNTSVSALAGINMLVPVNENWVIFVSPTAHYNLKSITDPGYPLDQKYLKTGIRLGTRLRL